MLAWRRENIYGLGRENIYGLVKKLKWRTKVSVAAFTFRAEKSVGEEDTTEDRCEVERQRRFRPKANW